MQGAPDAKTAAVIKFHEQRAKHNIALATKNAEYATRTFKSAKEVKELLSPEERFMLTPEDDKWTDPKSFLERASMFQDRAQMHEQRAEQLLRDAGESI